MNDILTSKPSVDHKPSYKQANHDGTFVLTLYIFDTTIHVVRRFYHLQEEKT